MKAKEKEKQQKKKRKVKEKRGVVESLPSVSPSVKKCGGKRESETDRQTEKDSRVFPRFDL